LLFRSCAVSGIGPLGSATQHPKELSMNRTLTPLAVLAAKASIGAALALGFTAAPHAHATTVMEDDPSWSCVDDGNKVCGPGNANGVPAGRYDEGGVLIDPWPVA
jgi:hypothetical protein